MFAWIQSYPYETLMPSQVSVQMISEFVTVDLTWLISNLLFTSTGIAVKARQEIEKVFPNIGTVDVDLELDEVVLEMDQAREKMNRSNSTTIENK